MTRTPAYPTLSSSLPYVRAAGGRLTDFAKTNPRLATGAAVVVGLAAAALVNNRAARKAERDHPPTGKFLEIDGCRLHYVEQGQGEPLVLLHGNGSMIQDFKSSGLMDLAAEQYRVLAFDRPGYGHSDRPRTSTWTADLQADLICKALQRLNIERALVLGHSWGASVAVALALKHPAMVRGLVLASGYYYPTLRADTIVLSGPAIPVIGDVIRFTIAPLLARLIWPGMLRKIFGPRSVPAKFAGGFPKEMALRPSQIRAAAAESALLVPAALSHCDDYAALKMPVTIIAGADDRLIDTDEQSARLHRDVVQSEFGSLAGEGHMIHQTATASVMAAIESTAARSREHLATPTLAPHDDQVDAMTGKR
jgi:pimeloyl-ACP methyl ester carboxylesterase